MIPDYEYISRLGDTGLEGEVWKVQNKNNGLFYACKIFTEEIPKEKIEIEADCLRKMGERGVSPKLIDALEHCIIMELVNGVVLKEYIKMNPIYNKDIIENLLDILKALIESNIKYADLNVNYNMMYDIDKEKLLLIDYGLLLTEDELNEYRDLGLKDKEITCLCALNVIFEVEEKYMIKMFGKDYIHTPIIKGFIPTDGNFPSVLKSVVEYIDEESLSKALEYTTKFGQRKKKLDKQIKQYPKIFNYEKYNNKLEEIIKIM